MKIGITINDYFNTYLEQLSIANKLSKTAICGLIVENFLSYNLKFKKLPLFKKAIRIVYNEEASKNYLDSDNNNSGACSLDKDCKSLNKEELIREIETTHLLNRDQILSMLEEEQVVDMDLNDELPF